MQRHPAINQRRTKKRLESKTKKAPERHTYRGQRTAYSSNSTAKTDQNETNMRRKLLFHSRTVSRQNISNAALCRTGFPRDCSPPHPHTCHPPFSSLVFSSSGTKPQTLDDGVCWGFCSSSAAIALSLSLSVWQNETKALLLLLAMACTTTPTQPLTHRSLHGQTRNPSHHSVRTVGYKMAVQLLVGSFALPASERGLIERAIALLHVAGKTGRSYPTKRGG